MSAEEQIYQDNLRLNQIECQLQHLHLQSRPRRLGLVLSSYCNIRCLHCHQKKSGDNLLRPAAVGKELRSEFGAFYPYLDTLRVQGGEVLAIPNFREIVEDVAATLRRPILSVSTNATLIDEAWAETIVRTPFLKLTLSIDAATPKTYARLHEGSDLETVLANVERVQSWKKKLSSNLPNLDSLFVITRANFREIPRYLELMRRQGINEVAFQPMEAGAPAPGMEGAEPLSDAAEVAGLHAILKDLLPRERGRFGAIRFSGVRSLCELHGLDVAFLGEDAGGLDPEASTGSMGACPNFWTTLWVSESGDAYLCHFAEPIGNIYETSLPALWNCPQALDQRSRVLAGRYRAAACSSCGRRPVSAAPPEDAGALLAEMKSLVDRALQGPPNDGFRPPATLDPVRRLLTNRNRRIAELESMFRELCEHNQAVHDAGQKKISELEASLKCLENAQRHINHLEAKVSKAISDFQDARAALDRYRKPGIVRAARKIASVWEQLTGAAARKSPKSCAGIHRE